ncbi:MAG: AEC family transporter [Acinetobacter sp.]|jgi:predicted permease|nr:MAG: AEC family transporter [Acinetobacter sp.]
MSNILIALFPLIILIVVGYLIKHYRWLSASFWEDTEKFNYYVLFPALFIYTLATAQIDFIRMKSVLVVMLLVLCIATTVLYMIRYLKKIPSAHFGVHVQSIVRFNSYVSLALVAALFHTQGMTILAILLAVSIPVINVISIVALSSSHRMSWLTIVKSVLKNPLIVSCVLGLLMNVLHIPIWQGLLDGLKLLAAASLPLGLLCVGAALQFHAIKNDVPVLLMDTFARLLAMPILAYWVCSWFDLSLLEMQVLVVFFALPTASASYILTKVLKGDYQLMAAVISLQTVCSAVTLPLVLRWVG